VLKNKVYIIGVSPEGAASLSSASRQMVDQAEILLGGDRLLEMFPASVAQRVVIQHNLAEISALIKANLGLKQMVVLASGDPNFFGIAGYLACHLDLDALEIIPNVSAVQLAFARIKESWEDAAFASAHSRPIEGIVETVRRNHKICILTDLKSNPAEIARVLLNQGIENCRTYVCQNLGTPQEEIVQTDLQHISERDYSALNIMILIRDNPAEKEQPVYRLLGNPEEQFQLRSADKSLITKMEIRAVSLAKLALTEESLLWDIGSGSGSVSIEASGLARRGRIWAIEKNPEDVAVIRENILRFARNNIEVIQSTAPNGLEELPDPSAVFIGGSSGHIEEILRLVCRKLKRGGRIVANVATLENLQAVSRGLAENGFDCEITLLNIARSKAILDLTRLEALNPVFIVTGWRKED
jgi:precorrin-6B C5,15-methyltransferase / cobalt-precorrin-6B C5,C15-methyltransferase